MTINTTSNKTVIEGNGATTSFPFTFAMAPLSPTFISVLFTALDGTTTTIDPANYTLNLTAVAPGQLWGAGGNVVYNPGMVPIPTGTFLTILRTLPDVQDFTLSNQGASYPTVTESMGDYITMVTQQIQEQIGRSIGLAVNDSSTPPFVYGLVPLSYLQTDADGNITNGGTPGTIAQSVAAAAASAAAALASQNAAATSATAAAASATTATTQAGIATTQAGIATAAATALSGGYAATSATNITIATGAQTFTTQSGKLYTAGQFLIIASGASVLNYMLGQVTSYSGTSLVVNVITTGGSGAHTDWLINISGSSNGNTPVLVNSQTAAAGASLIFDNTKITNSFKSYTFRFIDIIGSNNNVDFAAYLSTNNGSTYPTNMITQTLSQCASNADTYIGYSTGNITLSSDYYTLCKAQSGAPDEFAGEMTLVNPSGTSLFKKIYSEASVLIDHGYHPVGGAYWNSALAVNTVKFAMSGGTFSGTIECWGNP